MREQHMFIYPITQMYCNYRNIIFSFAFWLNENYWSWCFIKKINNNFSASFPKIFITTGLIYQPKA